MHRSAACVLFVATALVTSGCQHPTDPSSVTFSNAVDATVAPNPIQADTNTSGRTYRVVRGNNQPDDILAFDWHAVFTTTLTLNNNATNSNVDVKFPIHLTAADVTIKQASGGIVTTPSGGETEHFDYVISATVNQVSAINQPLSSSFEVWYDLPSLKREAVVEIKYSFVDNDNVAFTKTADYNIAP